jgi:hypothetical protein
MFALALPVFASFVAGYGVCWFSSSSPASAPALTAAPEKQEKKQTAPVKTFREELAEKVKLDYERRCSMKLVYPSELKLVEKADKSFLMSKLREKFRNAEPNSNCRLQPFVDHSRAQTAPCTADETRPTPSASPLFRGG